MTSIESAEQTDRPFSLTGTPLRHPSTETSSNRVWMRSGISKPSLTTRKERAREVSFRSSLVARPRLGAGHRQPDHGVAPHKGRRADRGHDRERASGSGRYRLPHPCAGKHVIVELKKVGRKMGLLEWSNKGRLYVDKLTKILREQNQPTPDIEVIFVLGKTVDEEASNPERLKSSMASISPGSRIVHYDTPIRGAQEA